MKKALSLILLIILLFCFAACDKETVPPDTQSPTTVPTTEPAPVPAEVYEEAAQEVRELDRVCLDVDFHKEVLVADLTFLEDYDYVLKYKNAGGDEFAAELTGTVDFDKKYTVEVKEYYADGAVYGFLDDFGYNAELEEDAFFSRYVPSVMLDASLYQTVEFLDEKTITFSGASDLEAWLDQDGFDFIDASGTAFLDDAGDLTGYTYDASYSYGGVVYRLSYTSEVSDDVDVIKAADKHAANTPVYDADIPLMIERSFGFLLQSDSFTMSTTETISSDAYAVTWAEETTLDIFYVDDLHMSNVSRVELINYATNELQTYDLEEKYVDGVFTVSENGGEPYQEQVFTSSIVEYARTLRDLNYPILTDIEEFYISEVNGGTVIDYTYTDSMADILKWNACESLTGDFNSLDKLSSNYELLLAEGYLAIDAYTGLPTALSVSYSGVHTIDGTDYVLSRQISNSYNAASTRAYTNITGEKPPVVEEFEEPTPVFYKVTGENGEQMWLLGTIHVGDPRTTMLPQEIYDAFDDADALAVEFDVNDFETQLAQDPALAEQLLQYYLYTDGTTIEDHLQNEDVFYAAMQTMKMTGQFNNIALVSKPCIWSQTIDDFYMRQGYTLYTDYGVDMQLLELAERQGKTILNVESGLEQLQMLTGYSDEIQEMILLGSLSVDPLTYNEQLLEMFEAWCRGDEAALIQLIAVDTSEMTAEELELYREYTKAMETDRNEKMLEVAKGYLSSGDTVFYAVGLAHLLAEDGLVNTLRQAGYTVELVSYQ